jgi:small subunit ribosomal protein S1
MINTVLDNYPPQNLRSHTILRFFAEDLEEKEKIKFVEAIFNRGSWVLPTEIFKSSDSFNLKEYTNDKFYQIFNEWVDKRIKHNSFLSEKSKNVNVPYRIINEFIEALFSINNLGFPVELLSALERLLVNCDSKYLKVLYEKSFNLVITNFDEKEIEIIFGYFSDLYTINPLNNIGQFLYALLDKLTYSHKVFNLSSNFIAKLNALSDAFKKEDYINDYFIVISILQIEIIKNKKLDLNDSKFDHLIRPTIDQLEKGNLVNLIFFNFLMKFNYSFNNYDVDNAIIALLERIQETTREDHDKNIDYLVNDFIEKSDQYFKLLLFYLNFIPNELSKEILIVFIKTIDGAREFFSSKMLWFNEYNNFTLIPGDIVSYNHPGFQVKIDKAFLTQHEKVKSNFSSKVFDKFYAHGFLHRNNIYNYKKLKNIVSKTRKFGESIENLEEKLSEIIKPDKFSIEKLNYKGSNRGNIIRFNLPQKEKNLSLLKTYNIQATCPSLELFLVYKSSQFLNKQSPFEYKSESFNRLFTIDFNIKNKFNLSEQNFWTFLKDYRPNLYEKTYLKQEKQKKTFEKLIKAFNNEDILEGIVKSRTRGGMLVDVFGMEVFLPGSQIHVKPIQNYDEYLDKKLEFKVIKIDYEFKSVVVSHKEVIKPIIEEAHKKIISELEIGGIYEGVVKNISNYGVFVSLGDIDGLIHITDLSWFRIKHPSEVVEINQKLNVVVIDFDENKSKIQLGLKQLVDHPWDTLDVNFKVGDRIKGKVKEIKGYGIFVEITPGVEGLIHCTEVSWKTLIGNNKEREAFLNNLFKNDDEINAEILTLDREERKMSLGIKQLTQDPWTDITSKYPVGSTHKGIVRNFTNFGVFVELEEGIDGLIHISDLSWTKKVKHPSEFTNISDTLEVVVLELDVEGRKLSLGHKQTTENPIPDDVKSALQVLKDKIHGKK